jgi:hypothetical protein
VVKGGPPPHHSPGLRGERVTIQFRMDAFNVFNQPVLGFNNNQGGSGQCIDCPGNGNITISERFAESLTERFPRDSFYCLLLSVRAFGLTGLTRPDLYPYDANRIMLCALRKPLLTSGFHRNARRDDRAGPRQL